MDLLQLRYFQSVARHEHVSRAAAELRVAQPSLSRSIARLESELGAPLFDRHGRGLGLNRRGAAFLARVDRALAELDDARAELTEAVGLEHGSVAVAAETLLTLTEVLAAFLAEHPHVRVRLHQSSAGAMLTQLRTGQVDLALSSQPIDARGMHTVRLAEDDVLLAVPPRHPLAAGRRVAPAGLAGLPFVTTRPGHWLRVLADRLFAGAGIDPEIACEADEPAAIRPLVAAGLGVGLLPATARAATPHPAVAWLQLDSPHARRTLRLVWRENAYLSAAARRFRELALQRFRPAPGDVP
ncbi:MAG TPA: LysR substrate-binding domain-containing protein [Streptosporangiales bacterium]